MAVVRGVRCLVEADPDERWDLARQLIRDDSIDCRDRVAGLLVLLYGLQMARIVELTIDQVLKDGDTVALRLGRRPLTLPPPLDGLVLELVAQWRGRAVMGHRDDHRWLFAGGRPGNPLSEQCLGARLRSFGISPLAARTTALFEMSADLPPAVLRDMLGYSNHSTTRWNQLVGAARNGYAAVSRTKGPELTNHSTTPVDDHCYLRSFRSPG